MRTSLSRNRQSSAFRRPSGTRPPPEPPKGGTLAVLACIAALALCSCSLPQASHGIPNFAQVAPGIWRGGQPNAEGWEYLKSLGVRKTVKLNTVSEGSDALATSNGIQVVYLPMGFTHRTFGKPASSHLSAAVAAIEPEGTFIHCRRGQDRTGLVVAAYRVKVQRWEKAKAYREMMAYGFHPLLRGLCWSWEEDVR